jgi:hypothetical protein
MEPAGEELLMLAKFSDLVMNSTGLGGIGIGIESPAVGMEQVVGHLHASLPVGGSS